MFHLAIAEIMKYQNKSFIAVAGKVAAIHEEIDKLKELYVGSYGNKTIKLAGKWIFLKRYYVTNQCLNFLVWP